MRIIAIFTLLVIFSLLDDSLARTKDEREFVFAKMNKQDQNAPRVDIILPGCNIA